MTEPGINSQSDPASETAGNKTLQAEVAIVGGGLVGATMAALLRDLPLRVVLIDKDPWPTSAPVISADHFDPRVSALTSASKACFEQIGVWEPLQALRFCPYAEMEVWDADGTGRIHFSARDLNEDELGVIVENSLLLRVLRTVLGRAENVELVSEQKIQALELSRDNASERHRLISDSGMVIEAGLVIAADGGDSPIRHMAGIKTREWDYGHTALVTTARTEKPHQHTARQRFLDTGPLAFLPLSPAPDSHDQHFSSIVWSMVPDKAREVLALDDEAFRTRLGFSFEYRLGEILSCEPRHSFPLRQRHAVNYIQEGLALIGDAAHTIHPLAGQGVNLGILDARALASELARGLAAGRIAGDARVLARYQRARIGHNLGMMGVMEGFKHLFASKSLPIRWLRNMGMTQVDDMAVIKNQLARRAMGL